MHYAADTTQHRLCPWRSSGPRRITRANCVRQPHQLHVNQQHRHFTEPWSSARRATARRRSSDQILVAGVEKKMPSIGGSQWWESTGGSFLNARGRTASVSLSFLSFNQRHVHLIEIKYCEDTRLGQHVETAQRQHTDLSKFISAKVATLHTVLLDVGGTCYTDHTLNQFKQLRLDHQRAHKLPKTLHAHSVQYANRLVTTRCAMENSDASHSQVLEPGASSNLPDPH
eukprot:1148098-Pelagomonas_calceolata.AAC.1